MRVCQFSFLTKEERLKTKLKATTAITLALLLISMLTVALNMPPIMAETGTNLDRDQDGIDDYEEYVGHVSRLDGKIYFTDNASESTDGDPYDDGPTGPAYKGKWEWEMSTEGLATASSSDVPITAPVTGLPDLTDAGSNQVSGFPLMWLPVSATIILATIAGVLIVKRKKPPNLEEG